MNSGWANLYPNEALLLYSKVVLDLCKYLILKLEQGFDLFSLSLTSNLFHDPVPGGIR